MHFSARLHDAVDTDTVLRRFLPVLAGERGGRRVAYAEYDAATEALVHRWSTRPDASGEVDDAPLSLEPSRIHTLLADDAGGDRPLRPADGMPGWVMKDLLPGVEADKHWVHARSIAHDGRWLGVLVVASPRRWWQAKRSDESVQAGGDVLELCLGRAYALRGVAPAPAGLALAASERLRATEREAREAREALDAMSRKLAAMEDAAGAATEMLMDAHVELDRRSTRGRRQTRLLYLLRRLLERNAEGIAPQELAGEIVRTVSEAFEGHRCSILLLDPHGGTPELRVGAAIGFPSAVDYELVRIPVGSGISGEVARSSSGVVVRDAQEAGAHELVRDEWYTGTAFVSLPLACRGRVSGVLNLTNFREGTIDDAELEQLRLVALCVGLLVDHARLADRLFGSVTA
jgi:putative methionine-R-sulfoxide reductase with GAF domain